MTVVFDSKMYAANTAFMPTASCLAADNPGAFINDTVTAWVNAIADPTKISIVRDYRGATSYAAGQVVRIQMNTPEGAGAAAGILFGATVTEAAVGTTQAPLYYGWSASASNNGYGTYTTYLSSRICKPALTAPFGVNISYEADVALPWICVNIYTGTPDSTVLLLSRLDRSGVTNDSYGSYVKSAPWHYTIFTSSTAAGTSVPINGLTTPIEGVVLSSNQDSGNVTGWTVPSGVDIAAFPAPMVGGLGYIGTINPDCAFMTGGTTPHPWQNESITLFGKTYRRATLNLWMRVA